MKLQAPHMAFLHCRNRTGVTMCKRSESAWEGNNGITVTHPHALVCRSAREKTGCHFSQTTRGAMYERLPVFPLTEYRLHFATKPMGKPLHAVADTEERDRAPIFAAEREDFFGWLRRIFVIHA